MIRIIPVKTEEKELLHNINQKYLYEMTRFYPCEMNDKGNYHYGYFEEYFTDPKRKAFFICNDETKIGFAMINPYSVIGHTPDYTMAEFTIFPSYRGRGYALEAAKIILSMYKGRWEIKYNDKNLAAKKLWVLITAPYNPVTIHLNDNENVFEFNNKI